MMPPEGPSKSASWVEAQDAASACRDGTAALSGLARLCVPLSDDPHEAARQLRVDEVAPLLEMVAQVLTQRLARLEQVLGESL